MDTQPVVPVPEDADLATEPARVVAKLMQVKNAVIVILSAAGYGATFTPAIDGAISDVIQIVVPAILALWTVWSTWKQGEDTREKVYAPATTAEMVIAAEDINRPTPAIVPGDPAEAKKP